MYSARSQAERGTMYQLRTLINRTNVPSDPQNNMNAAEDFMALLLHAHVVTAAETIADFNPMESVTDVARAIVANFIRFPDTTPVVDDSGEGNTGVLAARRARRVLASSVLTKLLMVRKVMTVMGMMTSLLLMVFIFMQPNC